MKNDLKRQKAQEKVSKIYTIYYIYVSRRDLLIMLFLFDPQVTHDAEREINEEFNDDHEIE